MKSLFVVLCLLGVSDVLHAETVAGPFFNPANGHAYFMLGENSWSNSQAEAASLGGHLVTIADQAEEDWVYATFQPRAGTSLYLWLGLTDSGQEGVFNWVDGSPATYSNWSPGEPNNFTGDQNYAAIWLPPDPRAPQWDDVVESQVGALGVVEIDNVRDLVEVLVPCAGPRSGGSWKNHGKYVSTITKVTRTLVQPGLLTRRERAQIISAAARSDCGKRVKPRKSD